MSLMQSAAPVPAETVAVPRSMTDDQFFATQLRYRSAADPRYVRASFHSGSKEAIAKLKKALARHYPDLKASHRMEALARGFGWRNWAAMREEMDRVGGGKVLDDGIFQDYVTQHGGLSGKATPTHLIDIVWTSCGITLDPCLGKPHSMNLVVRLRDGTEYRLIINNTIPMYDYILRMTCDPAIHNRSDAWWMDWINRMVSTGYVVHGKFSPDIGERGTTLIDYMTMSIVDSGDCMPSNAKFAHHTIFISDSDSPEISKISMKRTAGWFDAVSLGGAWAMKSIRGLKHKAMRYDIPADLETRDKLVAFVEEEIIGKDGPVVDYPAWISRCESSKFHTTIDIWPGVASPFNRVLDHLEGPYSRGLAMRQYLDEHGFVLSDEEKAAWDRFLLVGVTPMELGCREPIA